MKRILYIILWLALPLLSFADNNTTASFEKGNALYAKSNYKEALEVYKKLIGEGYQSTALYFNMGNASYKTGDIPSAILYYEKAHKLSPGDKDISFNIQYANQRTTDKVVEAPEFFITKWWKGFILALSLNTLSVMSIVLVLLASVSLIVYFFSEALTLKKGAFYTAVSLFVICLLFVFIANRQAAYFEGHKQAIVFTASVTVKSAPAEKAGNLFILHDGTKVNVLDTTNGWTKVQLANGNEGWLKGNDIKEI
ncbi:tetratricopeptide repeat protein [Mucilaginibacter gynuensis]|uniref:Tetratricopeptide repeat protein n=1 Tax=Mucilaginibacter gynuensis TaxID=1302236 RepID=A0ABP8FVD7_9SPHI